LFVAVAFAQPAAEGELLRAARSPYDLAKYAESHEGIDWGPLWAQLKVSNSDHLGACGNEWRCSAEVLTVLNPGQAILVLRGGFASDLFLRYFQEPDGSRRFAGMRRAYSKELDRERRYAMMRLGDKPFLEIDTDQSQVGFATSQLAEDWFDLTLPDFEPVFSFTPQGSFSDFAIAVWREWESSAAPDVMGSGESIRLTIKVRYEGPGMEFPVTYTGIYQRGAGEKAFLLKSAMAGNTAMPNAEFEVIGDAFKMTREQLLVQALPGLRKLATSGDSEGKEWLSTVLESAKDTPEKRELVGLLGKK
jgi:hypothetical protein